MTSSSKQKRKKTKKEKNNSNRDLAITDSSRRDFLFKSASASAAGVVGLSSAMLSPSTALADDFQTNVSDLSLDGARRVNVAANIKKVAANQQRRQTFRLPPQLDNNDEFRYSRQFFYSSFYKSLPQNQFGEVDRRAYLRLVRAMRIGTQQAFNRIPLDSIAERPLENPQGAFRFEMTGLDSHATRMPPAPKFRSAITAAEMGEVYWQALTRDVPYIDYGSHPDITRASDDLNSFSKTVGPTENNQVTPNTIFRGETPGDLNGPYISQLLLKDIPYGPSTIEQRYNIPIAGQEFMIDTHNWLQVQRGANPAESITFETDPRYIFNNRALGEYVHLDVLFQAYFNAALILLSLGSDALDRNNPYLSISNQSPFTSFGGPWLLQILTYASNLSLSGAWFQKWRVHRRLRPEAYGGRVHFKRTVNRNYELHPDILNSSALDETFSLFGTYLLPMAFPEGSPRHPSYPAGHATIAGACCTVLKAFFNEDYILPNTVQADTTGHSLIPYTDTALTLGGEVDKLANNVSIGRDAAGVHYRSDGVDGLMIGEQQAITLLRDHARTFNEDFAGFSLTKFDGTKIIVR